MAYKLPINKDGEIDEYRILYDIAHTNEEDVLKILDIVAKHYTDKSEHNLKRTIVKLEWELKAARANPFIEELPEECEPSIVHAIDHLSRVEGEEDLDQQSHDVCIALGCLHIVYRNMINEFNAIGNKDLQNVSKFYNPEVTKEITESGKKALAKILPARGCDNCDRDPNEDNCGMSYRQECVGLSTWIPKKS